MNNARGLQLAKVVTMCWAAWSGAAYADYVITPFDIAGSSQTDIWDISDSGKLVGSAGDATSSFGYVYDAGTVTRLYGPAGAVGTSALGISEIGSVVVGGFYTGLGDASTGHGFIYQAGVYTSVDVPFAGASDTVLRSISPDGRYAAGTYTSSSGSLNSFVLDRNSNGFRPVADSTGFSIAQGINSAGQIVGTVSGNRESYLQDLNTGSTTYFSFAGATRTSARAINDHGQIAGWLDADGGQLAWIGTPTGYQSFGVAGAAYTTGEGINNSGQVAGYWGDADGNSHGFIATPGILPAGSSTGGVYTFSTAVIGDVPIFIDPAVAVGYDYRIGAGDPLFKTVSLPVGIGDNLYEITVGGRHFTVAGNQIFDFTVHGFADGVGEFTVTGIETSAGLDPDDATAFVTRLTFAESGLFTGTQTALTAFSSPAPEPGTWAMMTIGLVALRFATRVKRQEAS